MINVMELGYNIARSMSPLAYGLGKSYLAEQLLTNPDSSESLEKIGAYLALSSIIEILRIGSRNGFLPLEGVIVRDILED